MGFYDKYLNGFKIGSDAEIELSFLLDPLKYLNMTGLMDYHWVFKSDMLNMV